MKKKRTRLNRKSEVVERVTVTGPMDSRWTVIFQLTGNGFEIKSQGPKVIEPGKIDADTFIVVAEKVRGG